MDWSSESGIHVGLQGNEWVYVGEWILKIAPFKWDFINIPSNMTLFKVHCHNEAISFF
jgi:hypothetical protein